MPNTLLSFALTPYFGLPSGDELAREWRAMHGPSPKRVKWEPDGITCEADGVRTIIVAARHPIPGTEAQEGTALSATRFMEGGDVEPHEAHLIVTSSAERITLKELTLHVTLVAALAKTLDAVGIYSHGATHPADFYVATAEEKLPLTALWCGVSYAKEPTMPGHVSFLTRGMDRLGLMELEWVCHHDDVKQGFEQLMDVATYVAELGRDLQPGETVGAEGTAQRIAVARAPLPTDKRGTVCRFEAIDPSAK